MVSSDDHVATSAGVAMLARGGTAVDAAIATNAVLAVTAPHACGLGGDLFALVHRDGGAPSALAAVGRAGSGADAERLRSEGASQMPMHGDIRSVTVPGCVDGWMALHERFGRVAIDQVLAPAIRCATDGFAPSPELRGAASRLGPAHECLETITSPGPARSPGVARLLTAVAEGGRSGLYEGELGAALVALARGEITGDDLERGCAEWVEPLHVDAHGVRLWCPPPTSQGYVGLAAWWMTEGLDLPEDPQSPAWPHLLSEAIRQSAADRTQVLHEHADGHALLSPERLAPRAGRISGDGRSDATYAPAGGATTYLCAADRDGMAVSLIQSNAASFGSHIEVPGTGVFLQNRGQGFSLEEGHPAEYGPGRRPPHTLSPYLVTDPAGALVAVLGTRGADAQPQVVLQLLVRLLLEGDSPAAALHASRWLIAARDEGPFATWRDPDRTLLKLEPAAPRGWLPGLQRLGHEVVLAAEGDTAFGSAHMITSRGGILAGASDPRSSTAAASGL